MGLLVDVDGVCSTDSLTDRTAHVVALLAGVFAHLLFFRLGEWDLYVPGLALGTAIADAGASYALTRACPSVTLTDALKTVSSLVGLSIAGVYASMLVYRAAFHRLNRFPGPFMARLTNFYITSRSIKKFRLFEEVQALHKQYGDIVRIGPSEISIADPAALQPIHSHQSACIKGPWYNVLYPVVSLQMVRDRKEHGRRRKIWDQGFSTKALRNYEPRVTVYTQQLLERLEQTEGTVIDMAKWFNFYSFDIMGDLAFGKSFDMIKDGIVHDYMAVVHTNMLAIAAFTHLIWMFPIIKAIPGLNSANERFQKWLYEHVRARRERGSAVQDVFSWILDDFEAIEKPTKQDITDLHGDAELIVVAGSDTTAATLTCLFFELSRRPDVVKKLQEEIDDYDKKFDVPSFTTLSKLEYLSACINETLRLYPAVPSGVQRMTPPEGLRYGETFIPGNTVVQIPTYTVHRDERLYAQPNNFIPERWTTKPELTKDSSAFAPFSTGRYSCVGKSLALMEIRSVTTSIIRKYDLENKLKEDKDAFHSGLVDAFTLSSPETPIIFRERKR